MSEWNLLRLEDICADIKSGGTPLSKVKEYYHLGTIPWLKTKEVKNQRIYHTQNFITEEGLKNSSAKLIPPNSVIVAMYGDGDTAGRVAINKIPLATNQACCNLIISPEKASYEFIYYKLLSSYSELVRMKTGSGQQNLSARLLRDWQITIPPPKEQLAIASILSSLDNKIELLQRQNRTLEEIAETLFRQWFIEEAEGHWEVTTLREHTEVCRGLSYKGSGLTDAIQGLPMHNLNSVFEGGGYKYEGIKYYKGDYRERHLTKPGDIIVTNTEQGHGLRLIGFPAIVPDYFGDKGLFSQHIYKLVPLANTILSREYIYYLLMEPSVREQITGATNGSTVNMLAVDGLQRPTFRIPPAEKLQKFTLMVREYWQKKNNNFNQIRTLTQLRDTLLPKLMSGEVRVKM